MNKSVGLTDKFGGRRVCVNCMTKPIDAGMELPLCIECYVIEHNPEAIYLHWDGAKFVWAGKRLDIKDTKYYPSPF